MYKSQRTTLVIFIIFFFLGVGVITSIANHFYSGDQAKPIINDEQQATNSISKVAEQVSPSVVGITNLSSEGNVFDQNMVESTGSGVILDNEGYIVTNNHVVNGADSITVTLADGNEEQAEIVGTDPRTDLAVIKVQVDNYVTPVRFGDSNKLAVGEQVVAIGNPLGLRFARSVTAGIVSGLNRLLTTEEGFTFRLIQTDAAINPGNSGGALVNLKGELIGINTVKIAEEGFEGMGFSIPSNQVKTVVEEIKQYGKVIRPVMGIAIVGEISSQQAKYFKLPVDGGVIVEPTPGGPADQAGLKAFDVISKVDSTPIQTGLELQEYLLGKKIGDLIKVEFIRVVNAEEAQVRKMSKQVKLVEQ